MTKTTNYNLNKPGIGDFYNVEDSNENMDIIDGHLRELNETVQHNSERYEDAYANILVKRGVDIKVLEGSYMADMDSVGHHQEKVSYPDGFTHNNCVVISAMTSGIESGAYTYGKINPPSTSYIHMTGTNPNIALSSAGILINTSGIVSGNYTVFYKIVLLLTE